LLILFSALPLELQAVCKWNIDEMQWNLRSCGELFLVTISFVVDGDRYATVKSFDF